MSKNRVKVIIILLLEIVICFYSTKCYNDLKLEQFKLNKIGVVTDVYEGVNRMQNGNFSRNLFFIDYNNDTIYIYKRLNTKHGNSFNRVKKEYINNKVLYKRSNSYNFEAFPIDKSNSYKESISTFVLCNFFLCLFAIGSIWRKKWMF